MKIRSLVILISVLAFGNVSAQSLSPVVVGSSGAFYSNGSGMLSSTVGEMAMVTTLSSGGWILTQGFQQAFDFGVSIATPFQSSSIALNMYPNPTSGQVVIQFQSSYSGEVRANIFDAIGKLVFEKTILMDEQSRQIILSMENLIGGMYLFEVKTKTGQYFSKINLIK